MVAYESLSQTNSMGEQLLFSFKKVHVYANITIAGFHMAL